MCGHFIRDSSLRDTKSLADHLRRAFGAGPATRAGAGGRVAGGRIAGTTGKAGSLRAQRGLAAVLPSLGGVHSSDVRRVVAITTNSHGKLHILRHHGDAFAVDSTKVAIVKEMNQISL